MLLCSAPWGVFHPWLEAPSHINTGAPGLPAGLKGCPMPILLCSMQAGSWEAVSPPNGYWEDWALHDPSGMRCAWNKWWLERAGDRIWRLVGPWAPGQGRVLKLVSSLPTPHHSTSPEGLVQPPGTPNGSATATQSPSSRRGWPLCAMQLLNAAEEDKLNPSQRPTHIMRPSAASSAEHSQPTEHGCMAWRTRHGSHTALAGPALPAAHVARWPSCIFHIPPTSESLRWPLPKPSPSLGHASIPMWLHALGQGRDPATPWNRPSPHSHACQEPCGEQGSSLSPEQPGDGVCTLCHPCCHFLPWLTAPDSFEEHGGAASNLTLLGASPAPLGATCILNSFP